VADGGNDVGLASAGQPEDEEIVAALDEADNLATGGCLVEARPDGRPGSRDMGGYRALDTRAWRHASSPRRTNAKPSSARLLGEPGL
jgi:hypothetical protein